MLLEYDLLINFHNKRATCNKPGNYWINIDLEEFNADFSKISTTEILDLNKWTHPAKNALCDISKFNSTCWIWHN